MGGSLGSSIQINSHGATSPSPSRPIDSRIWKIMSNDSADAESQEIERDSELRPKRLSVSMMSEVGLGVLVSNSPMQSHTVTSGHENATPQITPAYGSSPQHGGVMSSSGRPYYGRFQRNDAAGGGDRSFDKVIVDPGTPDDHIYGSLAYAEYHGQAQPGQVQQSDGGAWA